MSGIGPVSWGGPAVEPDRTVYDLTSLTKVVATTTATMLLMQDGRLELDAPVSRYLPEFAGGAKDRVTIRHLPPISRKGSSGSNDKCPVPRDQYPVAGARTPS